MEGSVEDVGAPESWEAVDLEESVKKLMLRDSKPSLSSSFHDSAEASDSASASAPGPSSSSSSSSTSSFGGEKVNEDVLNQVDPFLREALQNPRERLSVLRMEQDVQKFLLDPTQEQLEFQQLPTSYLRLAAHRVAQHYSLQSMVLLDNSLSDGSGSRIIVCKTSECRLPVIRLADIPINIPAEDGGAKKFAIKQRPQKHSQIVNYSSSQSVNSSSSKSVEERKEEYNKARAKIFSSADSNVRAVGKSAIEPKVLDNIQHSSSLGGKKVEEKLVSGGFDTRVSRGSLSSTMSASRPVDRIEKEPVVRHRPNNKVAIFRDREVDRRDPDYDRNYERYMQRFDPGFGFNGGAYAVQPMYSPAVNYNTEFPQLGSPHRPQISSEPQPRPFPQHLPALWAAPSTAAGLGYGHPDTIVPPFNPNHVGARSASSVYLQSPQYPCQQPVMPFLHQSYAQSQQQQSEMNFGIARPR